MRSKSFLAPSLALATLLLAAPVARAQEAADAEVNAPMLAPGLRFALRLEPGLAVALTAPQSQATDGGYGHAVKIFLGLTPYLEVGPSAAVTSLPAQTSTRDAETTWAVGAGARLMRPHDAAGRGFATMSPWFDADLLYVRTGDLNRPAFAAAAGVTVPIDERRIFWLGPFVRYSQIVQGERTDFDSRDAKVLSVGVSLEIGSGVERRRRLVATRDASVGEVAIPLAPMAVPTERFEVTNKIAFQWNSAELDDSSYPALDEIVHMLQARPGFRAEIAGHASSDGDESHNQALSEQRATNVLDYLVAHGVARERLVSRGFSSSVPVNTNRTLAERVTNRRVEFAIRLDLSNSVSRTAP